MSVYGLRLDWKTPRSSNIAAVAWQAAALYVRFHSGAVWRYDGVPEAVFTGMLGSRSKGQFFHYQIKGKYPETKVG